MTIFTVNAFDDGYFKNCEPTSKLQQFCMNSWQKAGFDIKVFDYNSDEVKEAKEKYKLWINSAVKQRKIPIASDPIRLYILSLYEDMMYFDTDMYLMKSQFIQKIAEDTNFRIFGNLFCAVHNGKDTQTPKTILEKYYNTDKIKGDKELITNNINDLKRMSFHNELIHLPRIENKYYKNIYVETTKDIDRLYGEKTCIYATSFDLYKQLCSEGKKDAYHIKYLFNMPKEDKEEFKTFMENGNDYDKLI